MEAFLMVVLASPFYIIHNDKDKPSNATVIVGRAMRKPYLTKSKKEKRTSYLLSSPENMIPAKAPSGVRNAPMLLPIMVA